MPKIIPLTGGLGNQLFQYAHGLKLSLIDKKEVIFDTSFFSNTGKDTHRPFLLENFNIDTTAVFKNVPKNTLKKYFQKVLSKITGNYGLYQSEKYFIEVKNEILKQYTLKNPLSIGAKDLLEKIKSNPNSVSLHIRRGDYVKNTKTNKYHGTCDLDYYHKAIDIIKTKMIDPAFFIFSDDIEWVKENLHIENAIYSSDKSIRDYEEMILMSKCSHNIIANSTFSWWGAYLNTNLNKIVIAPKQWTVKKSSIELDILPEIWLQI